jgi:hypothetical protein
MKEHESAAPERARLSSLLQKDPPESDTSTPLSIHISHGLAYTIGSALGSTPPTSRECLAAFLVANKAGLTAGSRAWSKHFHRSQSVDLDVTERGTQISNSSSGWWGMPSGPVAVINEKALILFWKITNGATWRNLHFLPHEVLVYEARVEEGYGMRWSQDRSEDKEGGEEKSWTFRGFVEPMMEGGHEVGWRH